MYDKELPGLHYITTRETVKDTQRRVSGSVWEPGPLQRTMGGAWGLPPPHIPPANLLSPLAAEGSQQPGVT